jgi:hypothetical protein
VTRRRRLNRLGIPGSVSYNYTFSLHTHTALNLLYVIIRILISDFFCCHL